MFITKTNFQTKKLNQVCIDKLFNDKIKIISICLCTSEQIERLTEKSEQMEFIFVNMHTFKEMCDLGGP